MYYNYNIKNVLDTILSLVSTHVLAGRTTALDALQCMITINPSLRNKSLRARNKFAHVELLRGFARPVPRYAVTVIYRNQQRKKQKRFSVLRKKKQS